jgi:hypothetical protein
MSAFLHFAPAHLLASINFSKSQPVRLRVHLLMGFLLVPTSICFAQLGSQTPSPSQIVRDADGIAVITKALTAMGGANAFAGLKDTKTEANCTRVSKTQSVTHAVRWTTAGDSFRYDGGDSDHRGMVNGPQGAGRVMDGKTMPISDRSVRAVKPIHFPGQLLFTGLNRPEDEVEMLKPEDVKGIAARHVRITDTKASESTMEPQQEDWFFDPQTDLPLKLTYSVPALNSLLMYVRTTVEYSNYITTRQNLMVPTTIRRSFEGGPVTTCTVSSSSVNNGPDAAIFSPTMDGGK